MENRYGDTFTSEACRSCAAICPDCPQPRLLPSSRRAVSAYLACRTQWVHGSNGQPTGLRAGDCIATLRLHGKALGIAHGDVSEVFAQVQVIERALVQCARERAEQSERERAAREQ